MHVKLKKRYLFLLAGISLLLFWFSIRPSNDRDWNRDQALLPYAEIEGDAVQMHNIRNFTYRSTDDYDIAYYDKTYNLDNLESLWYVVEPFSDWKGAAHTFLSFGFKGSEFVGISVEIRKEKGEKFSSLWGLFKQYELMYVIGDEQDLIKLRSNFRKDDVYVYPVRAPKDKIQQLFVSMVERANQLQKKPEFYNTLTNTCTTNIVRHINAISPKRVPLSFKVLFPGYSDELAYDLGLLDTDLPFEQARTRYRINERAIQYADSPDFSNKIRTMSGSSGL